MSRRAAIALAVGGILVSAANAQSCDQTTDHAIGLHGGAYTNGENITDAQMSFIRELAASVNIDLASGMDAVSAVEKAVRAMEASALYNAGRASITNQEGYVENDASIMSGNDLNAGAVGSLIDTKSPIHAARLVMEKSRHVMVVGDRGEAYVRELGAEEAPDGWFVKAGSEKDEHGTVGAVALDRCGNLAAATSTGGYDAKVPGRLGDVPVIGAGTYADNNGAAVSATGHGEWFIRHGAAHSTSLLVEGGLSVAEASENVLARMARSKGYGAVITLDTGGNFAAPHSTKGIIHAFASDDAEAYSKKTSGDMVGRENN
ncbi:MAG: isoaspartyl peptidase/L-asparaginase [Parvularculaceae bacterium]|nr:isoaspartyl peptidase/L-asparaginase [Parvularculaceae bacterium]